MQMALTWLNCLQVARYWEDPSNIAAAIAAGIDFDPPSNAHSVPVGEFGQKNPNHLQVVYPRAIVREYLLKVLWGQQH